MPRKPARTPVMPADTKKTPGATHRALLPRRVAAPTTSSEPAPKLSRRGLETSLDQTRLELNKTDEKYTQAMEKCTNSQDEKDKLRQTEADLARQLATAEVQETRDESNKELADVHHQLTIALNAKKRADTERDNSSAPPAKRSWTARRTEDEMPREVEQQHAAEKTEFDDRAQRYKAAFEGATQIIESLKGEIEALEGHGAAASEDGISSGRALSPNPLNEMVFVPHRARRALERGGSDLTATARFKNGTPPSRR